MTLDSFAEAAGQLPATAYRSAVARRDLAARVVSPETWHDAIADFDEIVQEQLHAYAAAQGSFSAIEPLLFFRGAEPVGGALVAIRRLPRGLASVATIRWGPMLRRTNAADAPGIYAEMVDRIATEYGDRRGMAISILSRPSAVEPNMRVKALHDRRFRDGSIWDCPETYLLDLRQSDEAMRSNLSRRWRGHLNRADRAGLSFEVGDDLAAFDRLYGEMLARKKFDDRSAYRTLPEVMSVADERLRPGLFFARHDGEIVAGAVVFRAGDRPCYLYGASSAAALTVNAGHFLHWNIARWLRDNTAARYYDLGFTGGVEGLYNFKSGLIGANGVRAVVPLSAIYASTPRTRILVSLAFGARRALAFSRAALGKLGSQLGRFRHPAGGDQA